MKTSRDRALFVVSLAVQVGIVAWLALAARSGCEPSTVVTGLAVSFIPYLATLASSGAVSERRRLDRIGLAMAAVLGAIWVLAPPILSDDLYRYLWEGNLWLEGWNPFRRAPDDPVLASLRDANWAKINNRPLATIYPPLSQLLFLVAAWLGGKVWTLKLLALVAHLASVAVFARISRSSKAGLALALNPLLLSEAALNGHFDILCGLALLFAASAIARHRFTRASLTVCAAVGLKVVGLVMLPLFVRRPRTLLATVVGSGLMLLPLVWWSGAGDPVSGTAQFAIRWRGNESLFAGADYASRLLLQPEAASLVARVVVGALLLMVCAAALRRQTPPLQAARAFVWAVLLLSPQVHPWYLAWLLPLELAAGASAGLAWTALVLLAYVPLDRWAAEGVWDLPLGVQIFEYALLAVALIADRRRPSLRSKPSDVLITT